MTQHGLPPRRFVILSAQGIHILQKLRPVEQLKQLMMECAGPDAEQVKAFFRLHKVSASYFIILDNWVRFSNGAVHMFLCTVK